MAQMRKLEIGAINITMHPHKPESYAKLIRKAYKLKLPIKVYGDQFAILSGLHPINQKQSAIDPLEGDIFRFTRIDKNKNWFNSKTNKFAEEEDIDKLDLPDNMFPNSSRFSYIFYPKSHLFMYEGYSAGNSFGSHHAERFVKDLFNQKEIVEEFGKIDVTHVPHEDALNDALALHHKDHVTLTITRPNPDENFDAEQTVMNRLTAMNVSEETQKLKSIPGMSIELDDETESLAVIAARNGKVIITGRDRLGKKVSFSTKKHPMRETEFYDSDVEPSYAVFSRMASSMKDSIRDWLRK